MSNQEMDNGEWLANLAAKQTEGLRPAWQDEIISRAAPDMGNPHESQVSLNVCGGAFDVYHCKTVVEPQNRGQSPIEAKVPKSKGKFGLGFFGL